MTNILRNPLGTPLRTPFSKTFANTLRCGDPEEAQWRAFRHGPPQRHRCMLIKLFAQVFVKVFVKTIVYIN